MRKSFVIAENRRGLLIRDGRLIDVLEPGRHVRWDMHGRLSCEIHEAQGVFASSWAQIMEKRHPELAKRYLETVRVSEGEVAIVSYDGRPAIIVRPGETVYVWKVMNDVSITRIDTVENTRLTKTDLVAYEKAVTIGSTKNPAIAIVTIGSAQTGLVYFDGELVETLNSGRYGYWQVGRTVTTKMFDTRPLPLEVTAQEILTKDKISLRVTLTSFVKVADAHAVAQWAPDYMQHLYKLVQFAVREAIGGRTLDEVLSDRGAVDEQIGTHVRREIGGSGVEVMELGIKDVILPGEMRELLNRVLDAEKTAQANLIRRREETASTRALLNTARLMEDNPTLLRLKELEALERVTERIGRIDVHASSGEGLNAILDKLVTLKARE